MFSNQNSETSSQTSGGIVEKIVKVFFNDSKEVGENVLQTIEFIVRKCAHFTIYCIGGILIAGFINTFELEKKYLIICTILFAALYACSDEIHQYFVPGRSCMPIDVLIDTCGATTGMLIWKMGRFLFPQIIY